VSRSAPIWHEAGHHDHAETCRLSGVKRTWGGVRFSFICALSASRGRVGERAGDPLHSRWVDAKPSGDHANAVAGFLASLESGADATFDISV
jgi:hypothetical protein